MKDILESMQKLVPGYPDGSHQQADDLLVELVKELAVLLETNSVIRPAGMVSDIIEAYNKVEKWYA